MRDKGETGMLYFLYSPDIISVLVNHDIQRGEFVLQVPFYPSVQTKAEFTKEKSLELVR